MKLGHYHEIKTDEIVIEKEKEIQQLVEANIEEIKIREKEHTVQIVELKKEEDQRYQNMV